MSETIYVRGIAFWPKVQPQQLDKKYNTYTLDFYPSDEAREAIEATGVEWKWKQNEHGDFIRVRRPHTKLIREEVVEFGPPKVVIATGEEKDGIPQTEPFTKLIGNGSEVTLRINIYGTKGRTGHRLEAVRIEKLVPYEAKPAAERVPTEKFPF